jgi:nitrogen fixation NifU-like protein
MALYQQVILEHNRKPKNFGILEQPSHQSEGFNPLCGDHLWLYVKQTPEGLLEDIKFHGSGCAISKASASMMTGALKGMHAEAALKVFQVFQKFLTHHPLTDAEINTLGKLSVFSGIWKYPSRVKCAGLAWHAFKGALTEVAQVCTEDVSSKEAAFLSHPDQGGTP